MAIIRALVIIFGCLSIAELIIHFTHWKLPPSILGLLLLFFLLKKQWIKVEWVRPVSDHLLQHLMLLLIPPCVALVDYLDIIGKDFWAITISTISSTMLVLIISAQVHTYSRKRQNK